MKVSRETKGLFISWVLVTIGVAIIVNKMDWPILILVITSSVCLVFFVVWLFIDLMGG